MPLDEAQRDRAVGTLLGVACGDALGAGYEFESAPLHGRPDMIGGGLGNFAPGEWTDDTAQTFVIAEVAAGGADLREAAALDRIAHRLADWWADSPPDAGILTQRVLSAAGRWPSAGELRRIAAAVHAGGTRTAGNGTLMRTAPVALAHLDDEAAVVEAAGAVAALTHADPIGAEGCALWCLAIRHAVLTGELAPLGEFVMLLPGHRRDFWAEAIAAAEAADPRTFNPNGFVVHALQAAWSAIVHTPDEPAGDDPPGVLEEALGTAISIGNDTDTVAAIAGALLGARWGAAAIPTRWRSLVHGWPGATTDDLVTLAEQIVDRRR